jgi:hypothetical protein
MVNGIFFGGREEEVLRVEILDRDANLLFPPDKSCRNGSDCPLISSRNALYRSHVVEVV